MANYIIFKTTDAGRSWSSVDADVHGPPDEGWAIYYNPLSKMLCYSRAADLPSYPLDTTKCSTDEGKTWTIISEGNNGFCFSGLAGITTGIVEPPEPALFTSDGGFSWGMSSFFDEAYQPTCLPGTLTFFAASEIANRVSRSDDGGKTWRTMLQFTTPYTTDISDSSMSGCIRSDYCGNLYISTFEGFFESSDTGYTWRFIGGPQQHKDVRFWVTSDYIYAADQLNPRYPPVVYPSTVWRYPLHNSATFTMESGSKDTIVPPGTDVNVNVPVEINPSLGSDSLHLVIRYDREPLELDSLLLTGGLSLIDSSTNGDTLNLWVTLDSNQVSMPPNVKLTFKTFLSVPVAKIHLDSTQFYGGCQTCNCALAVSHPDSVEIDFAGCGDSILLSFMSGGKLVFTIDNIVPNPASGNITVSLVRQTASPIAYELYDALGQRVLAGPDVRGTSLQLDVSDVPSGIYYLRFSTEGYVQSRSVAVEH